jgi:GT2 family glycosyltransferase
MKLNKEVTAIIPTFSNLRGLKQLLAYLELNNIRVIVVDNRPTSQKKNLCKDSLIKYIPLQENIGFAAAVNLGSKYVTSAWILILNDDIEFYDNQTIIRLVKYAQANKLIAVSPILQKINGEIENYGYKVLKYGKIRLNFYKKNQNLDGLTAACLLVETKIFKSLGDLTKVFLLIWKT